ncbi:MAG: hypothetical protein IPJ65_24695 [Archangiaceae bacterium]|nr:hypothetical protein [Archangiaceae bacterium]
MRLGLLVALAASACISDAEVADALSGYCANSEGQVCEKDTQCCQGFACLESTCHALVEGRCLFTADAGHTLRAAGAGCGCGADCASGACVDLKCE